MLISTNGIQLWCSVDGEGPAVLLMHGLTVNHTTWDPQVPAFSQRYRTIRPDFRGHGRSDTPPGPYNIEDFADDFLGVMDALGVESAHLVGLSMGGMAALQMALRQPDRVRSLVLVSTTAGVAPEGAEMFRSIAELARREGTTRISEMSGGSAFAESWASAHPDRVADLRAIVAAGSADGVAESALANSRHDVRARLGEIHVPTLVIVGSQDRGSPPCVAPVLVGGIQGARLVTFENSGHQLNWEEPDRFDDTVLGFLREVDA